MAIASSRKINTQSSSRLYKLFLNSAFSILNTIILVAYSFFYYHFVISNYGTQWNGFVIAVLTLINLLNIVDGGIAAAIGFNLYKPIENRDFDKIRSVLSTCTRFFRVIGIFYLLLLVGFAFIYPHLIQGLDFSGSSSKLLLATLVILIIGLKDVPGYLYGTKYTIFLNSNQNAYVNTVITLISNVFTYGLTFLFIMGQVFGKWFDPVFAHHGWTKTDQAFFSFFIVFGLQTISAWLIALFRNLYCRFHFGWIHTKTKYPLDADVMKTVRYTFFQRIVSAIISEVPLLFVSVLVINGVNTTSTFGIYSQIPNGLITLIALFVGGVTPAFGDFLISEGKDNAQLRQEYVLKYNFTLLYVVTTATTAAIILGNTFLRMMYGSDFVNLHGATDAYLDSVIIISLVAFSIFTNAFGIWSTLLNSTGKFKDQLKVNIIEMIILVIMITGGLLITKDMGVFAHMIVLLVCINSIRLLEMLWFGFLCFKYIKFSKYFLSQLAIQWGFFISLILLGFGIANLFFDTTTLNVPSSWVDPNINPNTGTFLKPEYTALILVIGSISIPLFITISCLGFFRNYFVDLFKLYWKSSFGTIWNKIRKVHV